MILDLVHTEVTVAIQNAHPPRFDYQWVGPKTLQVKYKSTRGLVEIFAGLSGGVGTHFREKVDVSVIGSNTVQIVFPS